MEQYLYLNKNYSGIEKYCSDATDFSKDVLPTLVGKVQTYRTEKCFIDIGTPETLVEAQKHAEG